MNQKSDCNPLYAQIVLHAHMKIMPSSVAQTSNDYFLLNLLSVCVCCVFFFNQSEGTLSMLIGDKVIRSSDFKEISVSTLEKEGTVVGLFFSAHWCPPSR